jgi:hypothetical protein
MNALNAVMFAEEKDINSAISKKTAKLKEIYPVYVSGMSDISDVLTGDRR